MTDVIRLERRGDIALILVNNPPVNALGHAVRKGLLDAFQEADEAPEVTAVLERHPNLSVRDLARRWNFNVYYRRPRDTDATTRTVRA